jgi:uncharacterized membrane protein
VAVLQFSQGDAVFLHFAVVDMVQYLIIWKSEIICGAVVVLGLCTQEGV